MDNENFSIGNSNWAQKSSINQEQLTVGKIPNANGSFVLGIVSLSLAVICCCCYGSFISLVTSIIGFVLSNKAISKYEENPSIYDEKSYKKAKAGKVLNIIAFILSLIISILIICFLYLAFTNQLPAEYQNQFDNNMRKYDFD